ALSARPRSCGCILPGNPVKANAMGFAVPKTRRPRERGIQRLAKPSVLREAEGPVHLYRLLGDERRNVAATRLGGADRGQHGGGGFASALSRRRTPAGTRQPR